MAWSSTAKAIYFSKALHAQFAQFIRGALRPCVRYVTFGVNQSFIHSMQNVKSEIWSVNKIFMRQKIKCDHNMRIPKWIILLWAPLICLRRSAFKFDVSSASGSACSLVFVNLHLVAYEDVRSSKSATLTSRRSPSFSYSLKHTTPRSCSLGD